MKTSHAVIAVFTSHPAAEAAVKQLAADGFAIKNISVVGRGYHTEEKVIGFYNIGDRVKFWGAQGAFWGGLWGLFFGGLFITLPVSGPVVVLGSLAATVIAAVESAVVVGGLSALGAALYGLGVPKDSVIRYEAAVKADSFLVMVHGAEADIGRAKEILETAGPSQLDVHVGPTAAAPEDRPVAVTA